jgi:hypothetical protein
LQKTRCKFEQAGYFRSEVAIPDFLELLNQRWLAERSESSSQGSAAKIEQTSAEIVPFSLRHWRFTRSNDGALLFSLRVYVVSACLFEIILGSLSCWSSQLNSTRLKRFLEPDPFKLLKEKRLCFRC